MKSLYGAWLSRLCLSQAQAAQLHDVSLESVKKWCQGKSQPKQGIWDELRQLEIDSHATIPKDDRATFLRKVRMGVSSLPGDAVVNERYD